MELDSFRLCRSSSLKLGHVSVDEEEEDLGLGFVSYTHGFGRKRVGSLPLDSSSNAPLSKRQRSERMMMMMDGDDDEKSAIETLPQDVLIRIICGVEHDDLKQLFNVSKSIREATVIAKQMHFAYSTPTKVKAFRTPFFLDLTDTDADIEAPDAPMQQRSRRSINKKKLSSISVALFV